MLVVTRRGMRMGTRTGTLCWRLMAAGQELRGKVLSPCPAQQDSGLWHWPGECGSAIPHSSGGSGGPGVPPRRRVGVTGSVLGSPRLNGHCGWEVAGRCQDSVGALRGHIPWLAGGSQGAPGFGAAPLAQGMMFVPLEGISSRC